MLKQISSTESSWSRLLVVLLVSHFAWQIAADDAALTSAPPPTREPLSSQSGVSDSFLTTMKDALILPTISENITSENQSKSLHSFKSLNGLTFSYDIVSGSSAYDDFPTAHPVTEVMITSTEPSEVEIPSSCLTSRGGDGEIEISCQEITLSIGADWVRLDCGPSDRISWKAMLAAAAQHSKSRTSNRVDLLSVKLCPAPPPGVLSGLLEALGISLEKGPSRLMISYTTGSPPLLGPEHLAGFKNFRHMDLSSNQIVELHPQMSEIAPGLIQLLLRNNKISLFPGMFVNYSNLEVLELGMNGLTDVPLGTFRGLVRLRLLNLWGNRLTSLSRGSLRGAVALENLDISNNPLTFLAPDLLTDIPNLRTLRLVYVRLSFIPAGLFSSNTKLQVFYLESNARNITLPSSLLAGLKELKKVHISMSLIQSLPDDLFTGSGLIENLTLSKHLMDTVPESLLTSLFRLRHLDLSYNRIDFAMDQSPFSSLTNLVYLDLSHNRITEINGHLFESLSRLETLKLNDNLLAKVGNFAFFTMSSLRTLDFSLNHLTDAALEVTAGFSVFNKLKKIENLDLSSNAISSIANDWSVFTLLKKLNLSNNSFTSISFEDLRVLTSGPVVDLRDNKIEMVDLSMTRYLAQYSFDENQSADVEYPLQATFLLGGNPLPCDCRNYDLALFARGDMIPEEVYRLLKFDLSGILCDNNMTLSTIDARLLTCAVHEECPVRCQCFYRPADFALVVNCSSVGLKELPVLPHYPLARWHLDLHLSNNNLTSFYPPSHANYNATTRLFLNNNRISSLDFSQLNITRVEMLALEGNNLTGLDETTLSALEQAKRLTNLSLHANPWKCDCTSLPFLQYIQRHISLVVDLEEATCWSGLGAGRGLVTAASGEACPGVAWAVWVAAAVAASVATVLAAVWIRARDRVRLWLFARGLLPSDGFCLGSHDFEDDIKVYDAFISFSHADHKFVSEELAPTLEQSGLRLCLHYRDWIVGDLIPHQIARSVAQSRRTVVILSPGFLTSVWGRMEFRVSYRRALEEGRPRMIVVLYGEIDPEKDVDAELKAYLQTNTYIRHDDPWFWERLRYALRRRGKQPPPKRPLPTPILLCPPGKKDMIIEKPPVLPVKV